MTDGPLFCEGCDEELEHDDIQTAEGVPQVDVDSFELAPETVDVHQCGGCGMVIGYSPGE